MYAGSMQQKHLMSAGLYIGSLRSLGQLEELHITHVLVCSAHWSPDCCVPGFLTLLSMVTLPAERSQL
jgi:aromatic ring-opening dioxygenase catalytic subunit (LigB family)